jgi:hypothetical protein
MPREEKEERVYLSASALSIAIILTVITVVALTIIAELMAPVKEFLTRLTGHHWITKGLAALVVFVLTVLIGVLVRRKESADPIGWSWLASSAVLVGTVVLFLFFIGHYVATR